METSQLLEIVRSILGQPTAPFHEDAVRGEICQQLAQCPHVTLEIDEFQNLIATYANGEPNGARAIGIVKSALRAGLLLLADGPAGNVLSLAPPFGIDDAEIAFVAECLRAK